MASTINAKTTGTGGIEYTADASGEIELQSDGVTKAKVTANGLQDANGNSLRGGSFRNLIINGDMQIAQRGTSATGLTTSGYNTVDRWRFLAANVGTWTQTQDTDVPAGQGFTSSLKMQCTTANTSLSAGSNGSIITRLEGQNLQHLKKGTANAESLTMSFWVKSNKTGTYIITLYDGDNNRIIAKSYTIDTADTWEKKTITFAGDTTGAFDNDNGSSLHVYMWLMAGTTYTSGTLQTTWNGQASANWAVGQVNLADSTSNYINITGVQLEVGEGASDFEFLPHDVEMARCERYFQKNYLLEDAPGVATSGENTRYMHGSSDASNNAAAGVFWRCRMRATPTVTWYTDSGTQGQWNYARSGASGTGSFIAYRVGDTGANGYIGVGVAWASCSVWGNWTANAEL